MQQITLLFLLLCFNTPLIFGQQNSFSIGEIKTLQSTILNEERTLNIYIPDSYYTDSTHQYPVIYLLDGSRDEDFIHIAGLVQFCSFSWINIIEESIVVGIENVDRRRDFTYPTTIEKDKEDFPTTGGSENFIQFLGQELQPFIEHNYRIDVNNKTIIGQSLGGLLTTEILLSSPDMFDQYIIISPSIWWDNQSLLDKPDENFIVEKPVYIGVGNEGKIMIGDAKKLYKKLKKKSSSSIHFGFFKEQNHGDALHLAVYQAFEKLFKKE